MQHVLGNVISIYAWWRIIFLIFAHLFCVIPNPYTSLSPTTHTTPLILVCSWFTFHSEKCMQPTGSHYHKSWCHTFNFLMQYSLSFKVKFQLVSRSWNEMIFYCISELILPTLIQRYDKKKNISFLIQFKSERLTEILQAVRCHILWSH